MADQKIELTVRVNSETGGIDILGSKLKTLGDTAKGTESSFLGLSGTFADLAKQFLPFVTVVGGATFAISKLTGFVTDSIKESESFRETITRMRSAIETTGGSWEKSGKAIEDWAQSIQSSTRFSDNQALKSLDRLTRATGNVQIAMGAATLAMDIHVKTGKDLESVTDLVTRLLLNQNRALNNAKLEFGNVIDGAKNWKEVIEKLSLAYGGAATSEHSLTSESSKLTHEVEDLQKNVGNILNPVLLLLAEGANTVFGSLGKVWVILKEIGKHGTVGAILNFKEIRAEFDLLDEAARKLKEKADALRASAGRIKGLGNYTPPKAGDESGGGGESPEEKRLREKKEADDKLAAMEDDLNIRMAQLGEDSLQKKLSVMHEEEAAEINKVNRMAKGDADTEKKKQATIDHIRGVYRKKEEVATQQDVKFKTQMALDTASIAISALQMINNASEINSKNDARRAKLLLALQQAITIANIWASNTKLGPWGVAKSIAETGLAVAAFAVQSKAIDKARATNNQEMTGSAISQDIGNGDALTEIHGTGGTTTSGGISSGISSGGNSGGGGGGAGTIINVGGVTVQFTADSVDLSSVEVVARRLGEEVLRRTTEGVHLAVAIRNVGEANKNLAI